MKLVHPKYGAYRTESPVEITRLLNAGYREEGQEVVTVEDLLFHPNDHTVAEVVEYLSDPTLSEAERTRVLAEEKAGQQRKGILGDSDV